MVAAAAVAAAADDMPAATEMDGTEEGGAVGGAPAAWFSKLSSSLLFSPARYKLYSLKNSACIDVVCRNACEQREYSFKSNKDLAKMIKSSSSISFCLSSSDCFDEFE